MNVAAQLDERRAGDWDAAETRRLPGALARLTPALAGFTAFDTPDRAVSDRPRWCTVLDRPLPDDGAGLDTVLDELAVAVEYGCRIGRPASSGSSRTPRRRPR